MFVGNETMWLLCGEVSSLGVLLRRCDDLYGFVIYILLY